jgi:hypothetical protein
MLAHALRHLTLRLWLTFLVGGLGSLALVPLLQALMGLKWVVLPVILFLAFIFMGMGWLLNTWAEVLVKRLRNEGAVWERAGMRREAAQRYSALMGVVDSFMFSPGRRRRMLAGLLPMMTRFYLDQERSGPLLDRLLRAHLTAHPGDAQVATRWLQRQLDHPDPPPWVHDLAQQIAEALPASEKVTALLARFYLANSRSDHAAIALYRRHWQTFPEFRSDKAIALAQLLSMEAQHDLWALDVYLSAWSQGAPHDRLRPVMRRCLAAVTPADEGNPLIAQARSLLGRASARPEPAPESTYSQQQPTVVGDRFLPPDDFAAPVAPDAELEAEAVFFNRHRQPRRAAALGTAARTLVARAGRYLGGRFLAIGPHLGQLGRWSFQQIRKPWGKALGLGIVALALILLIANTVEHLQPGQPPQSPPAPAATATVTDPFTIQVAAYLKAEDAKHFAARLKANGLDAYWTEAVGANRKWYQVRIDHFANKAAARQFGEALKAKGLINDFYVANYRPPQPPAEK